MGFGMVPLFGCKARQAAQLRGVIGSGSHSWRNQNKNATDFTNLLNKSQSCAGAGRFSSKVSSARLIESVKSVESVAFLFLGSMRSESGGKQLSPTSQLHPRRRERLNLMVMSLIIWLLWQTEGTHAYS